MSQPRGADGGGDERAQANLVTLTVALLALTAAAGVATVVADDAFAGADRSPESRRVAVALSERMVSADGPLTDRANVLNGSAIDDFDAATLRSSFPVARDVAVEVRLSDRRLLRTGDPTGGTTIWRVVLVRRPRTVTVEPPFRPGENVTLPRRTRRIRLGIDPPSGTTVRTVWANGRVVLHRPSGLDGTYTVQVSRFETTDLRVESSGPLPRGSVRVTYFPPRTSKAILEVTVRAR